MKNVKNTLFVATAALAAGLLAALLSGCDGSGSDVVGEGDAGRSEAGVSSDARATSCQVPTPKFSLNGMVTTKPRNGYWIVEVESVPCLSTIVGGGQPTNCADPVDGFASGVDQLWCYVAIQKVGGAYYLAPGYLVCGVTGKQIMEGGGLPSFGNWAVCSPSGKFLGWGM